MLGVSRPVAADTTGTITSELSTSLLIHALFLLVFVFQTNFCTPRQLARHGRSHRHDSAAEWTSHSHHSRQRPQPRAPDGHVSWTAPCGFDWPLTATHTPPLTSPPSPRPRRRITARGGGRRMASCVERQTPPDDAPRPHPRPQAGGQGRMDLMLV